MTDDLVGRLRYQADEARKNYPEVCRVSEEIAYEAADRIEKDAAHIDEMYELVAAMNADHAASKTRIERLEAELRELSTDWDCCAVSKNMKLIARKALDAE